MSRSVGPRQSREHAEGDIGGPDSSGKLEVRMANHPSRRSAASRRSSVTRWMLQDQQVGMGVAVEVPESHTGDPEKFGASITVWGASKHAEPLRGRSAPRRARNS